MRRAFISFARELLWRLMTLLDSLSVWRFGNLRLLKPTLVSAIFPESMGPFFEAEPEIRAPNDAKNPLSETRDFPRVGYRRLGDALVSANRRAAVVVWDSTLLIQHAADPGPWNISVGYPTVGGMLRQSETAVLVNVPRTRNKIENGIFVGTWSPHNWFHWLIDTLPSVYLANRLPQEFSDFPLLLPESYGHKEAWLEPLSLVQGNRRIVTLSPKRYSHVSDLIWIDSPTSPGPLPLRTDQLPRFRSHASALQQYAADLINALGLPAEPPSRSRRLYLARRQQGNRPYNQQELLAVAESRGFEATFLEDLSFRDSVQRMREASIVVGPHGAGWANALFCLPGTRGLMWTWDESAYDNWFANIGAVSGMHFETLFTGPTNLCGHDLDPQIFSRALDKLLSST